MKKIMKRKESFAFSAYPVFFLSDRFSGDFCRRLRT